MDLFDTLTFIEILERTTFLDTLSLAILHSHTMRMAMTTVVHFAKFFPPSYTYYMFLSTVFVHFFIESYRIPTYFRDIDSSIFFSFFPERSATPFVTCVLEVAKPNSFQIFHYIQNTTTSDPFLVS